MKATAAVALFGSFFAVAAAQDEDELHSGVAVVFELDDADPEREFLFPVAQDSVLFVFASSAIDVTLHVEDLDGASVGKAEGNAQASAFLWVEVEGGEDAWVRVAAADPSQSAEVLLKLTAHPRLTPAHRRALAQVTRLRDRAESVLRKDGSLAARELAQRALTSLQALPDDHPDLQWIRGNIALTMKKLGDLHGARELGEKVLKVFTRTSCRLA